MRKVSKAPRALIALGLLEILLACQQRVSKDAPPRPVRIEVVRASSASSGLRYSASIQAYEQVPLAFRVSGYLKEIAQRPGSDKKPRNLQQGDLVEKGAVLARIQDSDYLERVRGAEAQLGEAQAGLEKATQDNNRAEALYQAKSLTRPDYDAAHAAFSAAQARIEGARAQLGAAKISLGDCSLTAPTSGVVLSRSVEVGTLVGPGSVGFVLADLTRVKAVFGAPADVVERLAIGAPLSVTSEAFPIAFRGHVTALAPSADPQSRVFGVEVTVDNPGLGLRAGMVASVEVPPAPDEREPRRPSVSLGAVVKSLHPGGRYAVFVVLGDDQGGKAVARDVGLGEIEGNRVAVTSGLQPGERVVVTGASLLADGEAVRIIPEPEGE